MLWSVRPHLGLGLPLQRGFEHGDDLGDRLGGGRPRQHGDVKPVKDERGLRRGPVRPGGAAVGLVPWVAAVDEVLPAYVCGTVTAQSQPGHSHSIATAQSQQLTKCSQGTSAAQCASARDEEGVVEVVVLVGW